MLISTPIFEEWLVRLAPTELENYRRVRYQGDDFAVSISSFSEGDQARVCRIYAMLRDLLEKLKRKRGAAIARNADPIWSCQEYEEFLTLAQAFGRETFARLPSVALGKAIHDLRGGGLTLLLGQLEMTTGSGLNEESTNMLFYLTRDHLKIMRNVLLGLDDEGRKEDLRPRAHGTDLIVEKWHEAVLHEGGREARMVVDCRIATPIGTCCLEFGALDRILYNLINNACRHTADGVVRLHILPVPDARGEDLRFAVLNALTVEDKNWLLARDGRDLFLAGTTSTGSGLGLAIVSDFVSRAYGLSHSGEAVHRGYVGATLSPNGFAAWFHWPRA